MTRAKIRTRQRPFTFRGGEVMASRFVLRLSLALSVLAIPSLTNGAGNGALSKADYCVKFLTVATTGSSPPVLNVDWNQFRKNLRDMGYPDHIIDEKQNSIHFEEAEVIRMFRDQLDRPDWEWGAPLSDADYDRIADDDLVEKLGFLAIMPGFDAAKFMNARLRGPQSNLYGYSRFDDSEAKPFLWWSHLWLTGPLAYKNASALFARNSTPGTAGWLLRWLAGDAREKFGLKVKAAMGSVFKNEEYDGDDRAQFLLRVVTHVPEEFIPPNIKRALDEEWLSVKKYRPIRLPSVRSCLFGYEYAGNCQHMTNGHMEALGLSGKGRDAGSWRDAVIIRIGGKVVGSLKLTGDPSMIALRNVVDETGHLVLVMGGVYFLPKDLVEKLQQFPVGKTKRWRGVDLPELKVTPSTFLLNSSSWSDLNFGDLIRIAKNRLSKDELIAFMELFHERSELDDPVLNAKTWPELLAHLNRVRQMLEAN